MPSYESTDMPRILLSLGDFEFSIDTAAYNSLSRDAEWRWPEQVRYGKQDLLQYTGKAARTVTLDGEVFSSSAGIEAVAALYALSDRAEPQLLISSDGQVMGYWVVKKFSDSVNLFVPGGGARRKTFTLTIQHYGDDIHNP